MARNKKDSQISKKNQISQKNWPCPVTTCYHFPAPTLNLGFTCPHVNPRFWLGFTASGSQLCKVHLQCCKLSPIHKHCRITLKTQKFMCKQIVNMRKFRCNLSVRFRHWITNLQSLFIFTVFFIIQSNLYTHLPLLVSLASRITAGPTILEILLKSRVHSAFMSSSSGRFSFCNLQVINLQNYVHVVSLYIIQYTGLVIINTVQLKPK